MPISHVPFFNITTVIKVKRKNFAKCEVTLHVLIQCNLSKQKPGSLASYTENENNVIMVTASA